MGSWPQGVIVRGHQSSGSSVVTQVPALPVISIQSMSPDAWLQVVQRALQQTSGVFAISDLQKEMDWREACILSDMLLKSYMSATQHTPLELHPGVDLEQGEVFSSSRLTIQKLKFFHPHIDKGLFNVVLGARTAFRALFIRFDANHTPRENSVYDLTTGGEDALLAVVIPGYSLNLFEPRVPNPTHWVTQPDDTDRETQVFRCRLRPDFVVAGVEIGFALQQIEASQVKLD